MSDERNTNAALLGEAYQSSSHNENYESNDNSQVDTEVDVEDSFNEETEVEVDVEDSFNDETVVEDSFNDETEFDTDVEDSFNTDSSTDSSQSTDVEVGVEDSFNDETVVDTDIEDSFNDETAFNTNVEDSLNTDSSTTTDVDVDIEDSLNTDNSNSYDDAFNTDNSVDVDVDDAFNGDNDIIDTGGLLNKIEGLIGNIGEDALYNDGGQSLMGDGNVFSIDQAVSLHDQDFVLRPEVELDMADGSGDWSMNASGINGGASNATAGGATASDGGEITSGADAMSGVLAGHEAFTQAISLGANVNYTSVDMTVVGGAAGGSVYGDDA